MSLRDLLTTLRIMRRAGATWADYVDLAREYVERIRDYLDDRDWSWNV